MRACSAGVAQLVERNLAKVEVESSRLFSRSKSEGKHSGFPSIISSSSFALRRDSKMVMQRIANPPIPVRFWVSPPNKPARVVKLVDTTDLKSVARVKPAYRFDSGSGHQSRTSQPFDQPCFPSPVRLAKALNRSLLRHIPTFRICRSCHWTFVDLSLILVLPELKWELPG